MSEFIEWPMKKKGKLNKINKMCAEYKTTALISSQELLYK